MEKVKIKLDINQYACIASVLDGLSIKDLKDLSISSQATYACFKEINQILFDAMVKNQYLFDVNSSKKITKSISHSQALHFFGAFYSRSFEKSNELTLAFREMCRQIEIQLFIRGQYKLPQKGDFNG